jgi:hypothetical protein
MNSREVMWRREDGGVEHVRVAMGGDGGVAVDGVVAAGSPREPWRLRYRMRCDRGWRVRDVEVDMPEQGGAVSLHGDGSGVWRDGQGAVLAALDGCVDVDIFAVAFTNTLPVRRLRLAVGEAQAIGVAFVRVPELDAVHAEQRYTRLSEHVYRYESLGSGFRADLRIDADGLVVDYPGLVRRLWAR